MNAFILTTWLCLASNPTCEAKHSLTGPLLSTIDMASREECELINDELLALNPAPPHMVARHTCEPKGQGL